MNQIEEEIEGLQDNLKSIQKDQDTTLLVDIHAIVNEIRGNSDERVLSQLNVTICPLPNPDFTGRADVLSQMHAFFESGVGKQRVFGLYGMGGAGKSQLVFKFVDEWQSSEGKKRYLYFNTKIEFVIYSNIGII